MTRALVVVVVALGSTGTALAQQPTYCLKDYAEDLSALSPRARDVEARAHSYSYAVRTTGTYECVSYGADGNLKKTREVATAHGTAFGYRKDGDDTLLLTNDHVAEWPAVTDAEHPVEGIPAGCKRIADSLKIVDDDHDHYTADDIPLARVVADPTLDVAILRAHAKLDVLPWRVGKSASLAARAVVEVKGFPLGEFQATNVGKVISAYDHDDQGDWNHDDFVIDALLSTGGSGSPVLAVSCKTGEFELVGIFHAHYANGSALNVVIAIDQVRDLMTTLKRSPKHAEPVAVLDGAARARIAAAAHGDDPPFFSFGSLVASVHARDDGTLVFAVYPSEFPRTTRPLVVIEDETDDTSFGKLGAVYVGGPHGMQAYLLADADADSQAMIAHTLELLREDALAMFDYRSTAATTSSSRATFDQNERTKRTMARTLDAQREAAQAVVELASRPVPHVSDPSIGFATTDKK
jgi:serine protease Do